MIPETCILMDFMLRQMVFILSGLKVYKGTMRKHVLENEFIMAEPLMVALVKKGLGRQEAHKLVQKNAMKAFEQKRSFKEVLISNKEFMCFLTKRELENIMKPENYLGKTNEAIKKVLREVR